MTQQQKNRLDKKISVKQTLWKNPSKAKYIDRSCFIIKLDRKIIECRNCHTQGILSSKQMTECWNEIMEFKNSHVTCQKQWKKKKGSR